MCPLNIVPQKFIFLKMLFDFTDKYMYNNFVMLSAVIALKFCLQNKIVVKVSPMEQFTTVNQTVYFW